MCISEELQENSAFENHNMEKERDLQHRSIPWMHGKVVFAWNYELSSVCVMSDDGYF